MNENVIIWTKEKAEKGTEKNGKKKHKKRASKEVKSHQWMLTSVKRKE